MNSDERRYGEDRQSGVHRDARSSDGGDRYFIENIASESLKEQRRARRWGVFFKLLAFGYIGFGLLLASRNGLFNLHFDESEDHTAVVKVQGEISADSGTSAERIVSGLKSAFEDKNTAGVALFIDSPGGSPTQAGLVYDEVRRLKAEYKDIPLYAVIGDIGASGGYYIAAAADKIYANKSSLVGSIGVRSGGFGFVETLDKFGVERRLITSGDNKAFLDPFAPVKQDEVAHMETLLDNIHQQFIEAVREGRGDALKDDTDVFNGLMWTGEQAVDNGLIDGLGSQFTVARELFDTEKIVDFTPNEGFLEQLTGRVGVTISERLLKFFLQPKVQ